PRSEPGERERRRADGRADYGAHQGSEERELEDILRALERSRAVREARHQVGGDERFERVSDGDPRGGERVSRRGDVRQECSEQHSRPDADPEQEQRGERDTRGWPDGRGAGVHEGETESELRSDEVRGGETDE